jgi:hypothetical protein
MGTDVDAEGRPCLPEEELEKNLPITGDKESKDEPKKQPNPNFYKDQLAWKDQVDSLIRR